MNAPRENVECDVIVVGLGPTGLLVSGLLAQRGYRVVTLEKHEKLYGLPRAGHIDHEIIRFLQELGVAQQLLDDAFATSTYRWFNGAGQVILDVPWGGPSLSGYNSDYMIYQPVMENALFSVIQKYADRARALLGYEVESCDQDESGVSVTARRRNGAGNELGGVSETVSVRGAYLLAADGARSTIREKLAIDRDDFGFNEPWLDVDVRVKRRLPDMDPHQICDPNRPAFISPLGKRHHRFEWAIKPGEDPQDFWAPEKAWELLAQQHVGPDDVEIVRQHVYVFEARVTHRWRDRRIFLLGDAAHTMPPFMGQGACSGMRDAVNLAWKVDLVLQAAAPDALLDTYQIEREPHTKTWIDLSIYTGRVSCTLDEKAAADRDALLLSGSAPPMPDFPDLTAGLIDVGGALEPSSPVGRWFPQYTVSVESETGLFDDLAGRGFLIAAIDAQPERYLERTALEFLERIGAKFVSISSSSAAASPAVRDISGSYRRYFDEHGFEAVIVRPDYYIFGVAPRMGDLAAVVARLEAQIGTTRAASDGMEDIVLSSARRLEQYT